MNIETEYGNVEISELNHVEGCIYADCDLISMPEPLQKHIEEIIRESKQTAFEKRKDKLQKKGYHTLEEFENKNKIEIMMPFLGLDLDLRTASLRVSLNVQGYDVETEGVELEFHRIESIMIDPRVIVKLLLAVVKKLATVKQTVDPASEDFY